MNALQEINPRHPLDKVFHNRNSSPGPPRWTESDPPAECQPVSDFLCALCDPRGLSLWYQRHL